ncbi:hypothetical protein Dda_1925 [Drechslerella dactyloides]|uniref:Methyltransferase type 11 domain-containing protein n=1 Tax=Drechslerella dactyloides TaxID=74499 RepID=A0AAD6NM78_DREDA|nr:hypothetical protein Dda_1925 [Drechslerella dactyloides]
MLPVTVVASEADGRRASGSLANSPCTDTDDCESPSSFILSTPRYQPRSMPSPPLGCDATAETTAAPSAKTHRRSTSAKLHGLGLNVFKHGIKSSQTSTSTSTLTSTPSSPSKSKRRSMGFGGSGSRSPSSATSSAGGSPNTKHARHFSSHAFASYGPKPPISPTLSDARFPTASAGHVRSHSHQSSMGSAYPASNQQQKHHHRGVQSMYSNASSSPRINLDNWTESYLNNRNRGHKRNGSSRSRDYFVGSGDASESSQSEAGSPSYTHVEPLSAGGGRAVYHYDLTPESQQGSFPNSPQLGDASQMREVAAEAGPAVAPILQARLSSMYSVAGSSTYGGVAGGRETGIWSTTRSAAYTSMTSVDTMRQQKFASMEADESELLELEEMMSDMNSSETSVEREIRMLMREMLAGQEVVRTELEATTEPEVIPSPMLPQLAEEEEEEEQQGKGMRVQLQGREFDMTKTDDWQEIERWAGVTAREEYRHRESSVVTYDRSEIDDESMHEEDFERVEMEAAMARMSMRSSRHPAEDEGLNEMAFDPSFPVPEVPCETNVSTPRQQYPEPTSEEQREEGAKHDKNAEFTLGLGVSFEDLSIVDEELRFEDESEELRVRQEDLLSAAALELPTSRPSTKDGSRPQLSLLEVPTAADACAGRQGLESPTSGEESQIEMKGKTASLQRGGRRHNLKENEIRVEDPAYLVAFKKFLKPSVHSDAFVSRQTRFDAFQTRRICNELPHEYRPLPPCPPKAEPAAAAAADSSSSWHIGQVPIVLSTTPEQRRAKEVTDELTTRLWVFMAYKWLHYGRILVSPAHDILNQAGIDRRRNKSAAAAAAAAAAPAIRRRVLDLGGAPVADWGWHCAYEYPHSKVYTVTSRPKNINIDNVLIAGQGVVEKRRFTGPSNHRHIKVSSLWKLPFPDNHFDVISARSLHTILKRTPPPKRRSDKNNKAARLDEYALTLKECYRVLKPGGHFEWSVTDSDVIRAGPATRQLAEDFATDLEKRGYDARPTEQWLSRLGAAGFAGTKRAWTILPMAPPANKPKAKRTLGKSLDDDLKAAQEEMQAELKAWEELGVVKGSTKDVAALTGIVGTWRWEEWMVKVDGESENPAWKKGLVNGITEALDEGRENGSGFRCLVGWTRKPVKGAEAGKGRRRRTGRN